MLLTFFGSSVLQSSCCYKIPNASQLQMLTYNVKKLLFIISFKYFLKIFLLNNKWKYCMYFYAHLFLHIFFTRFAAS